MEFDMEQVLTAMLYTIESEIITAADLRKQLGAKGETLEMLFAMMCADPAFLRIDEDVFLARHNFFSNKYFSILPSKFEINHGVLIPGHRCLPFVNPNVLPNDYTFGIGERTFAKKILNMHTNDVLDYYSLYGPEYVPQVLDMDDANEAFDFSANGFELPGKMNITTVDLSELYEKTNFKWGDRLLVSTNNWFNGQFELDILHDMRKNLFDVEFLSSKRFEWIKTLESALLTTFKQYGPGRTIEDQLSYAAFVARDEMFERYCGSFDEVMKQTHKISFAEYGVENRLWFKDEEIPAIWNPNEEENLVQDNVTASASKGAKASNANALDEKNGTSKTRAKQISSAAKEFEQLLDFLLTPFSEGLVDSFVLDVLFRREKNCENAASRMVPEHMPVSQKERLFCLLHMEKRRAILQKKYNWFADYERGQLRSRILKLFTSMLDFVFSLRQGAFDISLLPQHPLVVLAQLFQHICRVLETIRVEEAISPYDMSNFFMSLDGMEMSFAEIRDELESAVQKQQKVQFTVIRKGGASE